MENLRKYDFELRHISGTDNKVADFLSCIHYDEPLSTNEGNYAPDDDDSKVIFCSISGIPFSDFVEATSMDSDLQDAMKFHSNGWPATILRVLIESFCQRWSTFKRLLSLRSDRSPQMDTGTSSSWTSRNHSDAPTVPAFLLLAWRKFVHQRIL